MCDHYNAVREAFDGKEQSHYTAKRHADGANRRRETHLIRSIAELIGVPFVKADATKFSETGYVGGDVEDLVRDLVRQADGDVERAQYGIIYIDEIDKIASSPSNMAAATSGQGVQTTLLKLMEETEVPARAPHDMAGQIQAMMDGARGAKGGNTINTNTSCSSSGAFAHLDKIVDRRLKESTIGFAGGEQDDVEGDRIEHAKTPDFIKYGFDEFIGRFGAWSAAERRGPRTNQDHEGSIVRHIGSRLQGYRANFEDAACGALPSKDRGGNRRTRPDDGLRKVFRDLKFELPSSRVKSFPVDGGLVDDPRGTMETLLPTPRSRTRRRS